MKFYQILPKFLGRGLKRSNNSNPFKYSQCIAFSSFSVMTKFHSFSFFIFSVGKFKQFLSVAFSCEPRPSPALDPLIFCSGCGRRVEGREGWPNQQCNMCAYKNYATFKWFYHTYIYLCGQHIYFLPYHTSFSVKYI